VNLPEIPDSIPVGKAAKKLRKAIADFRATHETTDEIDAIELVLDDLSRTRADIAHLRRSWAAISGCLIKQGRHEDLTDADLVDIPTSHRAYLRGHDATRQEAVRQYERATRAEAALRAASLTIPSEES
jgi:hypothetical protein